MEKIYKILLKISYSGINEDTSQSDSRHIQFVNYCSMITILSIMVFCAFDSIIAFNRLKEPILISILFIPLFIITIYLNTKFRYVASRHLLAISCISLTFIIAGVYFGKEAGEHYLFFLFAGVALVVNPISNWKTIAIVSLICAFAFIYIELFADSSKVLTPFPSEYVKPYKLFTSLFVFFTFIIVLVFYETSITHKDKQIELNTNNLNKINQELNKINEELLISHDVLVKMNSTKDEVFSIMAHDLRSPIGNILGATEILTRSFKNDDKKTTELFMDSIRESSKNTYNLLEDLLTWAMTQFDRLKHNPEQINLESIFKESFITFNDVLETKDIKIVPANINVSLYADKNMIRIVLRNLLSNAIKFSDPGGTIQIFTKSMKSSIEISVKDYGIGMSKERVDDFFQRKLIKSRPGTLDERGTGFGLMICRELIEKNNGKISIKSEYGNGTEVVVELPGHDPTFNDLQSKMNP